MPPQVPPSGAVRTAYVLVTFLLVGAVAFGLLAVVSVVVGLVRDGDSLFYGDALPVHMQLSPDDVGPLPKGLRVESWLDVTVVLQDPTVQQMLWRSGLDLGPPVLFIGAIWLVRGLLRSVLRGDPFGPANVGRLRNLGFLLAAGGSLLELLSYGFREALFTSLPPAPSVDIGVAGFALPGGYLLGGLAAFVLAAVFAHGAQLREDVEGTI